MSAPRVDVVDPGVEGGWIARALRHEGFEVRRLTPAEVDDVSGSVLVMAAEVPGLAETLARLRAGTRAAPSKL